MKSLINPILLKEQLRRFWVIGAAFLLLYILTVILFLINAGTSHDGAAQARLMVTILSMQHPMLVAAMVLAPFCVVMALYPYYFSGTATTTFHTFPITKRQLFLTNLAAGAILLILPVLILSVMLLVPVSFGPTFGAIRTTVPRSLRAPAMLFPNGEILQFETVNTFPRVFGFFMRMSVGMMFYFGVFKLAVSVSGSRVISVLLCGAFPFVPLALHGLVRAIGNVYVFGISDANLGNHMTAIASITNPVTWMGIIDESRSFTNVIFSNLIPNHLIYIAITVVLFAGAYMCARRRKHERTGDSVVFTSLKNVLVFAVSMLGMIAMGLFFLALAQSRFMLYVGFVIGFILAYLIAQMIAEKTFNIKHKLRALFLFGGIMFAAYILMLTITTFGIGFYVNRVPAQANIAGVAVQHGRDFHFVSDADIIARTREVHNEILNNRTYLRRVFWYNATGISRGRTIIHIAYLLENGLVVNRQYYVSQNFMQRSGIEDLMQEPQMLLARYRLLHTPEAIYNIRMDFSPQGGVERNNIRDIIVREDIESLAEAIKVDYIRNVERNRGVINVGQWELFYRVSVRINPDPDSDFSFYSWSTPPSRSTTMFIMVTRDGAIMQWLAERGYLNPPPNLP